ncbi:MAG: hypothetical protein M1416_02635 [Candidatus Pacearchaeota archaeon]|nr:hypothetical protein [Candidatus Pacearchaeota archaeon]
MRAKNLPSVEEENPVYFRVGYYESLESKKQILSSEMSFLNIIKIARRYNSLRKEELEIRGKIYKAIKELDLALRKTKASFPFLKIPETPKRVEIRREVTAPRKDFDESLEMELRKIQEKLKSIGSY